MTTLISNSEQRTRMASLEEAEAYVVNRPNTDWAGKTDDEKNQALIGACFWLETLDYQGDAAAPAQRTLAHHRR